LAFTIHSDRMDAEALSWFVDDTLAKTMLGVKGVGGINRVGGVNRQIWVELDTAKLQALNATAADISRQLRLTQIEVAGGIAKIGGSEQPIRTIATVQSAQALAEIDIVLSDGRTIR